MQVAVARQRKAHRKSRLGCSNCKLRSVKCDETKPSCRRCLSSGFACTYAAPSATSTAVPDLHFSQGGVFKMDPVVTSLPRMSNNVGLHHISVPLAYPVAGKLGRFELGQAELRLLHHFESSTAVSTMAGGGEGTQCSMHESSSDPCTSARSHSLAFHWYHGTALFHQMLSGALAAPTLSSSERDVLWIAAVMLASATFAYVGPPDADPHEAWPLRDQSPDDLDWLRMGSNKRVIWRLANPCRPESIFSDKYIQRTADPVPDGSAPVPPDVLPAPFYRAFDLGPASMPAQNPYHIAASLVSQLLHVEPTPYNLHLFLSFLTQIDVGFQGLVAQKDPRALVLLLHWMAKMAGFPIWWLRSRMLHEGLAVCMYIERRCAQDKDLMDLILMPRAVLSTLRAQVNWDKAKS